MNIDVLRAAHQSLEKGLALLEADQVILHEASEALPLLREAETKLWSQLEEPACTELLEGLPKDLLGKLAGFKPNVIQATARRLAAGGGF